MSVRFSSAVATQSPPSLGSRANTRRALFALASSRVALTLVQGGVGVRLPPFSPFSSRQLGPRSSS